MAVYKLYLEEVPSAVIRACRRPPMKTQGFFWVTMKYSSGKTQRAWMSSPTMTVTVYIPSWPPITAKSSISRIFPAIKNIIPTGAYLLSKHRSQVLRAGIHILTPVLANTTRRKSH